MATFPTTIKPSSAKLVSVSPTMVSTTHALTRQVRTRDAQRWAIVVTYPPHNRADAYREMWAFLIAQGGRAGAFEYKFPTMFNRGDWAGSPLIAGAGQAGPSVNLDAFTPGATIKAGDLFKIGSTQKKVYMVTTDTTADGSGLATVSIWPPLAATPSDNAVITGHWSGAPIGFNVSLADDKFGIDIDQCERYGLTLELEEVL